MAGKEVKEVTFRKVGNDSYINQHHACKLGKDKKGCQRTKHMKGLKEFTHHILRVDTRLEMKGLAVYNYLRNILAIHNYLWKPLKHKRYWWKFMDFWLSFMAVVSTFVYLAANDEASKRTIHIVVAILTTLMAETGATRSSNIVLVIAIRSIRLFVGWLIVLEK
nr:EGF-like domain-containing protein [Tanacetum cinerariifolium]